LRRLLIVGAGIGGLTLLCAMHTREPWSEGWIIDVAERARDFDPVGAGIVLHPNGVRVLARLGLEDEVVANGSVIRELDIIRARESRVIPLGAVWAGVPHPTVAIGRAELHQILFRKASSLHRDGYRLRMPLAVLSVQAGERTSVVSFGDGTSARYDLVVGADGVHSSVRSATDPASAAVSTGNFYIRFAAANVIALRKDTWQTTEFAGGSHGCIPLSQGRLHCFVQFRAIEGEQVALDQIAIADELTNLGADLAKLFDARIGPAHTGFGYLVRPVTWGRGATVLVGDSAHAISPTLSEGGSLAMEDSLVLALALRDAPTIGDALARFRAARHERAVWAQRMSQSQGRSERPPAWAVDASAATAHMRAMYAPLRIDPAALLAGPE
jgi:2-polyprenyl-6-methoxyphenol hydroxylase-like FAD-dependent oxidoreductase